MRGEQAIFNLEIKKKRGLSLNPDIHHSKVFSSEYLTGNPVSLPGNPVSWTGNQLSSPGNPVGLPWNPECLPGNPVSLPGNPVSLPGKRLVEVYLLRLLHR